MEYYQLPISKIFEELKSGPEGLSEYEALIRLKKFGPNQLREVRKTPLIFKFLSEFKEAMALVLIGAAILSWIIGAFKDALIIFGIVFINAVIGFIQEYKAERILAAFKKHLPSFAKVIRGGKLKRIKGTQVVPGDILVLEPGDAVSADARLINSFNLKTNDFSLTGESHPQLKRAYEIKKKKALTDIDNMVFMGTSVVEGTGRAIVVKTAMETEFGKIAKEVQKVKEEPTPLQRELIHTGKITVSIAIFIAVIILGLFTLLGKEIKEGLIFAIASAVAVVPEGLPAATSIALSLGAQRMLKKKALVKKLVHVESLGSVTTICTDKTGTLTTGQMSVVETKIFNHKNQNKFLDALVLCNNASLDGKGVGDPLEVAFLKFANSQKKDINKIQRENPRVFELPFSSKRRMMSVVSKKGSDFYVWTKGACLEVLRRCNLSDEEKEKIIKENNNMATKGLRILAVAFKKIGKEEISDNQRIEQGLEFLGLVGVEDPPREGVKEALNLCRRAKIKVIMITGDYELTALAIARQINMVGENARVITGEDLHQMDDERLKEVLKEEVIFARIEPKQKLRIVKNLKEMGEVVAVTGDGVNDAPALVAADIGVAMGKIGTEVAKEAADMILLDDHFATIVNAVKEGRRIFDNARKFVFYVFSSNSGELFVGLFGLLLGLPLPLLAIQILAIDLGTDVLPSLALGVEEAEPHIMEVAPVSKTERLMNPKMLLRLLFVGCFMAVLGLITFLITLYQGGWHYKSFLATNSPLYFSATASTYATLVFCQIANAFSCRSERVSIFKLGFFSNLRLIYAELVSLILLFGIIGFQPLQNIFKTEFPSSLAWVMIVSAFFISLKAFEWYKLKGEASRSL